MADRYACFAELAAHQREGNAYRVRLRRGASYTAIVAPHGGGIERGWSEVAWAIAGKEHPLYSFEGTKGRNNQDLHITSTRFDEPGCLALLQSVERAVTVHGAASRGAVVFLGGRDGELAEGLRTSLQTTGFVVKTQRRVSMQGRDRKNVCNRCRSGAGVQLELTEALQRSFFESLSRVGRRKITKRLQEFAAAVRKSLVPTRRGC